jgi:hypothetical protein
MTSKGVRSEMRPDAIYKQYKSVEKGEIKNETHIRSWSFLFVERANSLGSTANVNWPNQR